MNLTNQDRANRAAQLLKLAAPGQENPIGCAIRLVEDLRHWCDSVGFDFREVLELSHLHYLEHLAAETFEGEERPAVGRKGRPAA